MKQYRNYFKSYYNLNFSKDYEVHHIDLNHNNNDITNLMLLPKKLHNKYHFLLNAVQGNQFEKVFNAKITGNAINSELYNLGMAEQLIEVLNECNKWYDYKMYLDGCLHNIHDIDLRSDYGSI